MTRVFRIRAPDPILSGSHCSHFSFKGRNSHLPTPYDLPLSPSFSLFQSINSSFQPFSKAKNALFSRFEYPLVQGWSLFFL
ncbi:hypothetical protein SLE2022_125600 [Rubroshorea leprosula]